MCILFTLILLSLSNGVAKWCVYINIFFDMKNVLKIWFFQYFFIDMKNVMKIFFPKMCLCLGNFLSYFEHFVVNFPPCGHFKFWPPKRWWWWQFILNLITFVRLEKFKNVKASVSEKIIVKCLVNMGRLLWDYFWIFTVLWME